MIHAIFKVEKQQFEYNTNVYYIYIYYDLIINEENTLLAWVNFYFVDKAVWEQSDKQNSLDP